jgi:6-phosphogluconolactonase
MSSTDSNLMVFPDLEQMSAAAADLLAAAVQRATLHEGEARVALSGGSTPKRLFQLLAEGPWRTGIPWDKVHFFWADERAVPPDDPASNYRLAAENLFSKVNVPEANIHRMRGELDPREAADLYEAELRRTFGDRRLHMALLGMGEDGHTASLFPGTPALEESDRWAVANPVEKLGETRITLTLPFLAEADELLFLVSGESKAEALHQVLEDGGNSPYPAGALLRCKPDSTWILDKAAASLLRR